MSTAAVLSEYRTIPLSLIDESTTNPRRTFEPAKLVELAKSISTHGLLQPITVRQKEDRFEIIAGARRYRAAQIAELADLPTRVLELNDAQTLEAQLIENSQREDVHPYEEASGYQRLLDLPGYDVATLVEKSGNSPAHVYSRLTLLSLIPDVAESFQKEEITASHANLLARLNAEQQALAFPHAFRKDWNDSEKLLLPAKALATWIQDNLYLALAEAPFDTQSATLLPEAGSCPACPKRTGFNTALFADISDDNCLDGSCFRAKINAHIESAESGISNLVQISTIWRPKQDKPANELAPGEFRYIAKSGQEMPDSPTCESMAPAIVTYGHGVGIIHAICANHDCPVHYPNPHFDGETREKWQAEQERQAAERKQRDEEKARREERLRALILRFPSSVTADQMRFLLTALLTGNIEDGAERIAMRFDEENTDNRLSSEEVCIDAISRCLPSSLFGYLAELALGSLVMVPREEERDFITEAEQVFPVQTVQPTQVKKVPAKGKAKKTAAKKTVAVKAVAKTKRR